MKKILVLFISLMLLAGCSFFKTGTAEMAVDTFFSKYKMKDEKVIKDLKETISLEDMTEESKKKYQDLMEKQYDTLSYTIKNVNKISDDTKDIEVEIRVFDYKSALLEAEAELSSNPEKFNDENGKFSNSKYMDYKIEKMEKVTDMTDYTLNLNVVKENDKWTVTDITNDDIAKIHGMY